jgi:hypothetical protein
MIWLRRGLIALVVLVVIVAGVVFLGLQLGERRAARHFDIAVKPVTVPTGSVTSAYQPVDWVRTIRHSVHPSGRPLRVMPSEDDNRFTDADVGALIAYVLSLPPGAGGPATTQFPLPARVLYGSIAVMPFETFKHMSDVDARALHLYLKSLK